MDIAIYILLLMGGAVYLSGCATIFVEPTTTPVATATNTPTITPTFTPTPTSTPDPAFENGKPLVARVNGWPIYQFHYETALTQSEESATAVLEQLIDEQVVLLIAYQHQLTVTQTELERIIEQNKPATGSFELWLKRNRLTKRTLKAKLRQELLRKKVVSAEGIEPPDFDNWLAEKRSNMSIEQYNIK